MEMKIKDLYALVESPFVLDVNMTYPEIEGDESNFLTEYSANKSDYDKYFLKEHGNMLVEVDGISDSDIIANWKSMITAIQRVFIESWAHIYYTLNIAYNPVYNVEEDSTTVYGQHETTEEYGQHTTQLGERSDTITQYSVAFNSQLEEEVGKTVDSMGAQSNTSNAHTDTNTSKRHEDTYHREGNIGVVAATKLASDEALMREKHIFFKDIFLTITREVGAYYDNNFI